MNLQDRTVVVTGATGNLGRAVAEAVFAAGGRCVVFGRDMNKLRAIYGADGPDRAAFAADALDMDAIGAAIAKAAERMGRLDALCNCAGGFTMGDAVHETPLKTWRDMMDMNATSVLVMASAVVPRMLTDGGGQIVNVAAGAGLRGGAAMGAYAAAKSAVIRLTESMSAELRERNINVNCILPSIIDTPENRAAMPKADPARWVSPEAIANVILFLISDESRPIHGAAVPVPGLS